MIAAFSVFSLPKDRGGPARRVPPATIAKLKRLQAAFGTQTIVSEYETHVAYAAEAYARSGFSCSYLEAWRQAIKAPRAVGGCRALAEVLPRKACFAGSTSGIEQSFSQLARVLPAERLNTTPESEELTIRLLLTQRLSDTELDELCARAQVVFDECFPNKAGRRLHLTRRADKGVRHRLPKAKREVAERLTERSFLSRCHRAIAMATPEGVASTALQGFQPRVWTPGHAKEQRFQDNKRHHRLVEAHLSNLTLPHEITPALTAAVGEELARRNKSWADRQNRNAKQHLALTSQPPNFRGLALCTAGLQITAELAAAIAHWGAPQVQDVCDALVFIAADPWQVDLNIQLVAMLRGGWVVTPSAYTRGHACACKFFQALRTKRLLWVSDGVKAAFVEVWRILHKLVEPSWELLPSPQAYATAKARAEIQKRPATVIGLVTEAEHIPGEKYLFTLADFTKFIGKTDMAGSLLGLGAM